MDISKIQASQNFYTNSAMSFNGLGASGITLEYAFSRHRELLPQRMVGKISEILSSANPPKQTLRELHLETYSPLLECKTLDEARNLFPEFREVLDAQVALQKKSITRTTIENHCDLKDLSLKLLQDLWGKLRTQSEIAQELGLADYKKLDYIKDKIRLPNRNTHYTNLLNASDPALNAEIARKTAAYNALHPDLMLKRNRHAAQFTKKPEYRQRKKEQSTQYYIDNPEKRAIVGQISKSVWDRLPHIKQALRDFMDKHCHPQAKQCIKKHILGEPLTAQEKIERLFFYKKFWEAHPQLKAEYSAARRAVIAEFKEKGLPVG